MASLQLKQSLTMAERGEVVEHGDSPGLLLQSEVPHVGDQDHQFFLVVGPAKSFGGGFDDHDTGIGGSLLGQRSDAIGVPVIGHVDPAPMRNVLGGGESGFDLFPEGGHSTIGCCPGRTVDCGVRPHSTV